eukprot:Hpha_TRINITY_DN2927_c0_g1::TRINITY_DN2927_c0_g1_i1::g.19814::m.19814
MLRDTGTSYRQILSNVDAARRNVTVDGLHLTTSSRNASCSDACADAGMQCHEESLQFWPVTRDCKQLSRLLDCRQCEPGIRRAAVPGTADPGICLVQLHLDDRFLPSCHATDASVRRACPCVHASTPAAPARPWDGRPLPTVKSDLK